MYNQQLIGTPLNSPYPEYMKKTIMTMIEDIW